MSTTDQLLTNSAENGLIPGSSADLAELQVRGIAEVTKKRAIGFEPTTSSLGSWHSTTELRPQDIPT